MTWPVFLAACVAFAWSTSLMLWIRHEPVQGKHRRIR